MPAQAVPEVQVTAEIVREFEHNGYVIVEDALPPQKVEELLDVIERFGETWIR